MHPSPLSSLLVVASIAAPTLHAGSPAVPSPESAFRDADSAMAAACAARQLASFRGFLDGASVFVTRGGPVRGPDEIAAAWAPFFEAGGPVLRWGPEEGWASRDGALGVTSGPFTLVQEGAEAVTGRYLTVWRRGEDGRLRVAFDLSRRPPLPAGARRTEETRLRADGLDVTYGSYAGAAGAEAGHYVRVNVEGGPDIETAIEHPRPPAPGEE